MFAFDPHLYAVRELMTGHPLPPFPTGYDEYGRKKRQATLLPGLDCLPDQQDLFATAGGPDADDEWRLAR